MPGKKKGANQHNNKHENGNVAPGKRVSNQKQTSPGPVVAASQAGGSTDNPATKQQQHARDSENSEPNSQFSQITAVREDVSDIAATGASANTRRPRASLTSSAVLDRSRIESASDGLEESNTMSFKEAGQRHGTIDVNTAKQSAVHSGGMVHTVTTVLSSTPMTDTFAILTILLALPSTVLQLTNVLFTLLTFVPPSGSFTTLPSLSDITSSFSPGAPSLMVVLFFDLIAFLVWSFLPIDLQAVVLDCAQATVATTLGGTTPFRSGSSDNFLLVILGVLVSHALRIRRTLLKAMHRAGLSVYLPSLENVPLPAKSPYVLTGEKSRFDPLWICIALHILVQGITRMVRKALNAPRESSLVSQIVDPEANGSAILTGSNENAVLGSPSLLSNKMSLQNLKDASSRVSSSKKRRKQANLVRSQQPLWAAVAATKAKIQRELGQTNATKDDYHAGHEQGLGDAPFRITENAFWVTKIMSDKFCFETGPILSSELQASEEAANKASKDESPPFFIRVNGAPWSTVKRIPKDDPNVSTGYRRWTGEVYGISPNHTYKVEFLRKEDNVVLHTVSIVTRVPTTLGDDEDSKPVNANATDLRPAPQASPLATVRQSIAAVEKRIGELTEQRNRIVKDSKAFKVRLTKEITGYEESSSKAQNAIEVLKQKQTQLNAGIKSTEDATTTVNEQLEELSTIPEELRREWRDTKENHDAIKSELTAMQEDVAKSKDANNKDLNAAQQKFLRENQHQARLLGRVRKLESDLAALENPNRDSHGNASVSSASEDELARQERDAQQQLDLHIQREQVLIQELQVVKGQIAEMELARQTMAYQQNQTQDTRPVTPEGDLPGTNPHPPGSNQSGTFNHNGFNNTPESNHGVPVSSITLSNGFGSSNRAATNNRHRSQSALSGGSYYQVPDDTHYDEDPIRPEHRPRLGAFNVARGGSDDQSSGSGSPHVGTGNPAPFQNVERRTSPPNLIGG